jgi:hypothetical protein
VDTLVDTATIEPERHATIRFGTAMASEPLVRCWERTRTSGLVPCFCLYFRSIPSRLPGKLPTDRRAGKDFLRSAEPGLRLAEANGSPLEAACSPVLKHLIWVTSTDRTSWISIVSRFNSSAGFPPDTAVCGQVIGLVRALVFRVARKNLGREICHGDLEFEQLNTVRRSRLGR